MVHIFNSINELHGFLTSPEALKIAAIPGRQNASITEGHDFTQTSSLSEALTLLKHGTKDPKYDLTPKHPLKTPRTHSTVKKPFLSPVGFAPHVPNALLNLPNSTINKRETEDPRPAPTNLLTIVRDVSYSAGVEAEKIRQLNLQTTEYIRALSLQRPAPILSVYAHIGIDIYGAIHHILVRVKAPQQRLIVPTLNFVFCHPSFLRRCIFRWEEVSRHVEVVPAGYGSPISTMSGEIVNHFKNHTVQWIPSNRATPPNKSKNSG